MKDQPVRHVRRPYAYWLLILPFVATLWPALYAHAEPSIGGVPFFYWYQFLCIGLTAVIIALVYILTPSDRT
jgi:Protein of unknown function (DUF3311)